MDWTAGYASDVEYVAGYYQEQSPSYLNFVCVLNGYQPVNLEQSFTYFELGFGRGLTVNVLAAANPQGQFYAADFNPAHVAGARELADQAGLNNLTLYEKSFAELAEDSQLDLPQFDFITLHGIYTWVTAENQQHIVNFITKYLKPGGIVYLSYNAMPGWAAVLPLQRFLVEYADAFPNRSNLQVEGAAAMIVKMEEAAARYLLNHPSLKVRLEAIKSGNRNYLVHEYMHKHWAPRYHADIARDLAAAKMDFVGSADLPFAYENLYLSEEKRALVDTMTEPAMRETMKDYFLNTSFRKDVFVRGARKLGSRKQTEALKQLGAVLIKPRSEVDLVFKLTIGEVNGKADLFNPVLDALERGPCAIDELMLIPELQGQVIASLAQVIALLAASGAVRIYWKNLQHQPAASAQAMNLAFANQTQYSDEYQIFASSVCGGGVSATYIERLTYLASREPHAVFTPEALAPRVWALVKGQGKNMLRDGKALETDEENLDEVLSQVRSLFETRLRVWEQLKLR